MESDSYQPPAFTPPPIPGQPGIGQILLSFDGGIPRRTFWLWRVVTMVAFVTLFSLISPAGGAVSRQADENTGFSTSTGILMVVLIIPLIWIGLALAIKRWHDRGKAGVWVLIGLIPLIGPVWSFIECGCLCGTFGDNPYGSDQT